MLTNVGTRRPRVQAGEQADGRAVPCIARNVGPWPSCTTRPRSTSRRSSLSKRKVSYRCGPGSSSGSDCRPRRCPRRSAGWSTGLRRARGRPPPAASRKGRGPRDDDRAPAPAGRAPARRRDRARVGEGARRGRPLGARHLGRRRREARAVARRSGDVPARQSDPRHTSAIPSAPRSRSPTRRSGRSPSHASANGSRCRARRSCSSPARTCSPVAMPRSSHECRRRHRDDRHRRAPRADARRRVALRLDALTRLPALEVARSRAPSTGSVKARASRAT